MGKIKNTHLAGALWEKKVREDCKDKLNNLLFSDGKPYFKYHHVKSSRSRGRADDVYLLRSRKTNREYHFGVQCKRGYESPARIREACTDSKEDTGMDLIFAIGVKDKGKPRVIKYVPEIDEYLQQIIKEDKY